jgi:hypothetical protein
LRNRYRINAPTRHSRPPCNKLALGTYPTAVNNDGLITGYYYDANFVAHGFIRLPGNDAPDPMAFALAADPTASTAVPEPSIWAMMLLGFVGLAYVGFKRASRITLA